MSDETPNASDNLNGSDPSMEDILASIRKIISDDEPVALESPEDIAAAADPMDAAETAQSTTAAANVSVADFAAAEGESVDLNIDDVLAGLDEDIRAPEPEMKSAESAVDIADGAIADGETVDDDAFSNVLDDILTDEAKTYSLDETDKLPDAKDDIVKDDIISLLGDEIPLEADSTAGVMPEAGVVPELVSTETSMDAVDSEDLGSELESLADNDSDDIEALLNSLLGEEDPLPIDDPIETPIEENLVESLLEDSIEDLDLDADEISVADLADPNAAPSGVEETEDLDLVKSLMADLSDDPAAVDAIDTDEDLESLLSIPDINDVTAETSSAEAESDGDIMGEIVDMAIEDELQTHPEDLAALEDLIAEEEAISETAEVDELPLLDDVMEAEQENIAENAQLAADAPDENMSAETTIEETPSLSDIATAAEADAVAVETAVLPTAAATASIGALAGLTAIVASRAPEEISEEIPEEISDEVEISDETPDINQVVSKAEPAEAITELTPEPLPNQETKMPIKAVITDTIIDDVTEAATADAFAELNQVVEDKAIFNERGPRIGDLVQEALRPMLKEWLDANLKSIVERAVTKEVKRISKGQ